MVYIILFVISFVVNISLGYYFYRLMKVSENFESKIVDLEKWILDFKNMMENTYFRLKNVDDCGIFEKDDYVGFLFNDILNIINECYIRINDYNGNAETNKGNYEYKDISRNDDANNKKDIKKDVEITKVDPYFSSEDRNFISEYLSKKQ